MSDRDRADMLAEEIERLYDRLHDAAQIEKGLLRNVETLRTELEQARAEAERYRVALEQYADGKNWGPLLGGTDDEVWDPDMERGDLGPDLARTALSKEADGE